MCRLLVSRGEFEATARSNLILTMQGFAVSMSHYIGSIFTADSLLRPDYRQYGGLGRKVCSIAPGRPPNKSTVIYFPAANRQPPACAGNAAAAKRIFT